MNELPFGVMLILSLLAAALPTILYILLIWRLDIYEREPLKLLILAFLWGAVPAAMLAAIIGSILSAPFAALSARLADIASASLIAPPVEEGIKALALLGLYLWAREELDDALDGVIYGSLVGFGFAMSENVLYLMSNRGSLGEWATVVVGRTVIFGLNHAMFTSFTGAALGLAIGARGRKRRTIIVVLGFLAAVTAHFGHNFLLSVSNRLLPSLLADWAGIALILVIVFWSWWRERHWIAGELAPEVAAGVLSAEQYEAVRARRPKPESKSKARKRAWRRFYRAAVELAFAKHRQHREHPADPEQVIELRKQLVERGIDLRVHQDYM